MPIKSLSHFINQMKRVHQHEELVEPKLAKQAEQTQKRSLTQLMNGSGNDVDDPMRRLLQTRCCKTALCKSPMKHCEIYE